MTYTTFKEIQCDGKHPYPTRNLAQGTIDKRKMGGPALQVYLCQHCGFHHVGHATPKKQNLKRYDKNVER
jgi:hypothetical protein